MRAESIDPRAKLGILLLCVLAASFSPSLLYTTGLVTLILLLGIYWRRFKYARNAFLGAALLGIMTWTAMTGTGGSMLASTFMAFLGLLYQVYPCGVVAGLLLSGTKVNQFMAAMNRLGISDRIVIPLAIMLRYMPVVRDDWLHIKDAMRMREISPSLTGLLKQPMLTLECIYVPMIMNAAKAADELTIAALTRGIDDPVPHTCMEEVCIGIADIILLAVFLLYFIGLFMIKGGII